MKKTQEIFKREMYEDDPQRVYPGTNLDKIYNTLNDVSLLDIQEGETILVGRTEPVPYVKIDGVLVPVASTVLTQTQVESRREIGAGTMPAEYGDRLTNDLTCEDGDSLTTENGEYLEL